MTRLAIVTGVSRGLGEALAAELLGRGWEVLGLGRHDSPRLASPAYRFVRADLAQASTLESLLGATFAQAASRQPTVAALVNNAAAAGPVGVLGRLPSTELVEALEVNLAAPAVLCNLFLRTFVDRACDRRIVNVSSGAAERPLPGIGPYCVAKAGMEMLTRAIAAEQGDPTLRAITLRPGVIDTEMQVYIRGQSSETLPSLSLFQGFHTSGQLVPAATVARKTVERLLEGPIEPGRTYSYAEL
jgi:NAD(P)-dependent dehydrogenase (short-subunit alcohol dehydrogenase family)